MKCETKRLHVVKPVVRLICASFCATTFVKFMRDKLSSFVCLEWRDDFILGYLAKTTIMKKKANKETNKGENKQVIKQNYKTNHGNKPKEEMFVSLVIFGTNLYTHIVQINVQMFIIF